MSPWYPLMVTSYITQGFLWLSVQGHKRAVEKQKDRQGDFLSFSSARKKYHQRWREHRDITFLGVVHILRNRPERWIVTIPSSDQWLATIGNHWKTIVSNGRRTIKPLKKHFYQWFLDPKTIGKPLLPMVLVTKNHCYQ